MRGRWVDCALLALGLVMAAGSKSTASRRSSLAGNFLFEDSKDVFFFPHQVVRYVNHVWFDFVTGQGVDLGVPTDPNDNQSAVGAGDPHLGSGGILIGNAQSRDFGIGIATHRADFQGALWELGGFGALGNVMGLLANIGYENAQGVWSGYGDSDRAIGGYADSDGEHSPDMSLPALEALNWIDLLVGYSPSPGLEIGGRLSIAHNLASQEALEGRDAGSPNPGASATTVNVLGSVGYGESTDPFYIDGALELTVGKWAAEGLLPPDQRWVDEGSTFGVGMLGRGFLSLTESISFGVMAELNYRSRSTKLAEPGGQNRRSYDQVAEMLFQAAAGPRYYIGERAIIAAYATIGLLQVNIDPEGRRNVQDNLYVMLPGINIAGEFDLTSWLTYRAGLLSYYGLYLGEQQKPLTDQDDTGGYGMRMNQVFYYWSNGFGITALNDNFTADAMLNWPIITEGPYLLSGRQQSTFAMVSVGYSF